MLAEAREAQWSAQTFMGNDVVKALAPAKVNLFLAVGEKLESGYHEVVNVMHSLAIHDILYFTCTESGVSSKASSDPADPQDDFVLAGPRKNIKVSIELCDKTHISGAGFTDISAAPATGISVTDNLIFKAIDTLAKKCDVDKPCEINVRVEKHIPMQAGLGGGSSDAAATLKAMQGFWESRVSDQDIADIASSLGADVPFFLEGGCALYDGLGEKFAHSLEPVKHPAVLVRPPAGVPTAQAYGTFDENPQYATKELLDQVIGATKADEVPLFNNLQSAACKIVPEIAEILDWLQEKVEDGVVGSSDIDDQTHSKRVLMSGSGSCVFAIVDTYAEASAIAAEAAKQGWWSRASSFSSIRACAL